MKITKESLKLFIGFDGDRYIGATFEIKEKEFCRLIIKKDCDIYRINPEFLLKNDIELNAGSATWWLTEDKDINDKNNYTKLDFDNNDNPDNLWLPDGVKMINVKGY